MYNNDNHKPIITDQREHFIEDDHFWATGFETFSDTKRPWQILLVLYPTCVFRNVEGLVNCSTFPSAGQLVIQNHKTISRRGTSSDYLSLSGHWGQSTFSSTDVIKKLKIGNVLHTGFYLCLRIFLDDTCHKAYTKIMQYAGALRKRLPRTCANTRVFTCLPKIETDLYSGGLARDLVILQRMFYRRGCAMVSTRGIRTREFRINCGRLGQQTQMQVSRHCFVSMLSRWLWAEDFIFHTIINKRSLREYSKFHKASFTHRAWPRACTHKTTTDLCKNFSISSVIDLTVWLETAPVEFSLYTDEARCAKWSFWGFLHGGWYICVVTQEKKHQSITQVRGCRNTQDIFRFQLHDKNSVV